MRKALAMTVVTLVTAGCTGSSLPFEPHGPGTASPAQHTTSAARGWPTYHGDNQRSGVSNAAALRPPLARDWSTHLDGPVYAQPLVVGGRVLVATEINSVYALRAGTGAVLWRRHLATPARGSELPCGNIDPLGITGTPVYDDHRGLLYVATESTGGVHTLRALSARTGRERWHRSLDVVPGRDRLAQQQRGALLLTHGRVYVPFGGLFGDCGNYVGYLAGVPADGTGRVLHYAVPTDRAAGMWAPPGPVQDKTGNVLYIASGNGAQTGGRYDGSDSVIELSPRLERLHFFAPSTWPQDNAQDLDLGSTSPVADGFGTVVIAGKRGTVYLLSANLGGIGGELDTLDGCAAYGGASGAGQIVFLPCRDGVRRLDVGGESMQWSWQLSGVAGSPTTAGSALYALDLDAGDLVEANVRTGHLRARIHVGTVSRFATPVPVGRRVFVGTLDGVVAVRGAA